MKRIIRQYQTIDGGSPFREWFESLKDKTIKNRNGRGILERLPGGKSMKMKRSRPYRDDLLKDLKDPKVAVGYLNAVLEEGDQDAFLLALRYVVEAQGGMTKLARTAKMNRVNLYRMLSRSGNPELENLANILHALGFRFNVVSDKAA